LAALAFALSACSTVDIGTGTTSTTVGSATGETTTSVSTATTGTPMTTASSAPATTTTTTTIVPAPGAAALTRVVFTPAPYVLITNVGSLPVDVGGHWLASRERSAELPPTSLGAGETVAVGLGGSPPELVGVVGVMDLGQRLGAITADDGELALFASNALDDASAIVDYVEWGSSGHRRSGLAVEAGIWTEGAFVGVPPEAGSIASSGRIGAGPEDWFADLGG
jgi:hypothetical protein